MNPSSSKNGFTTPKRGASAASAAGSITDEQFRAAFESVQIIRVNASNTKELIGECQKICAILENLNNDWSKRMKALQSLRSILMQNATENEEFVNQCYQLVGTALHLSVKDLRSQVCREACITVAYFCEKMETAFWKVAELILPTTISLAQNSAKIMATSAMNANHYIAKYIRHPKILAIILQSVSSKAKEVRRCVVSLLTDIIANWESQILDKNWKEVLQAVKLAINDADSEVRVFARQAFDALQNSYPAKADFVYQELEPAKQRMLGARSTSSSTHSINSERDNLQSSNRGLYTAQQNAFLAKRSTSDLNYSMRKLNLGSSLGTQRIHRPNVVRGKPPHVVTPMAKKVLPTVPASASRMEKANSKSSSQPGSRSGSPNRNRPPRSHIPAPATERKANPRDVHNVPTPVSATQRAVSNPFAFQRDVNRALKNVDMQARNVRPNVVRYDEDRTFGVSPSSGFVSRNQVAPRHQLNESPQDFYGNGKDDDNLRKQTSKGIMYSKSQESDEVMITNGANGINNGQNKWFYSNPNELLENTVKQEAVIREICVALEDTESNIEEKHVDTALLALSHMIRDNAISLWNEYFNRIFLAILQSISHSAHVNVKLSALRTLKDLCISQPRRLILKPELAVVNVLHAHNCDDASVVRVAEECGATLAFHLPTNTSLKLLLTVIDDENTAYHQLSGAIKMLSRVLEKVPDEEVENLLPNIVPRMMKCYENSQSMVRRASIICLVAISNSVGIDVLKPHLNASTLKLVQVYRDRMSKRSE